MAAIKQPQDRLPKKEREYTPHEYEIDGERYPVINTLTFDHATQIEDATGKAVNEVTGVTQFGLMVWLAVSAVVPSLTWEHFKVNTSIESVEIYDKEGLTVDEWTKKYPEAAKAAEKSTQESPKE